MLAAHNISRKCIHVFFLYIKAEGKKDDDGFRCTLNKNKLEIVYPNNNELQQLQLLKLKNFHIVMLDFNKISIVIIYKV